MFSISTCISLVDCLVLIIFGCKGAVCCLLSAVVPTIVADNTDVSIQHLRRNKKRRLISMYLWLSLAGRRLLILRFHRLELVSQCFDRTRSMASIISTSICLWQRLIVFSLLTSKCTVCCRKCCSSDQHSGHSCYDNQIFGVHTLATERKFCLFVLGKIWRLNKYDNYSIRTNQE